MMAKNVLLVALFLVAAMLTFTAAARAVDIQVVPVGNPGNLADFRYDPAGYGRVEDNYWIGKYEVTAGQYRDFLNAVAKNDPYGLYNSAMALTVPTDPSNGCGITRSGSPFNYHYDVAADSADRPVNYVSLDDTLRFANWLHNGQPGIREPIILTGNQVLDAPFTEDGAYDLRLGRSRKPNAKYFIPTENEWYKAAYHKNDGVTGNYWGYPTDPPDPPLPEPPIPGRDPTETTNPGDNANYWGEPYPIELGHYTTKVGQFYLSHSAYGTFDQGGNVSELTQDPREGFGIPLRGGSFDGQPGLMHASYRAGGGFWPWDAWPNLGFRVGSTVPEPGSVAMLLGGAAMAIMYWWRRHAWPFR